MERDEPYVAARGYGLAVLLGVCGIEHGDLWHFVAHPSLPSHRFLEPDVVVLAYGYGEFAAGILV